MLDYKDIRFLTREEQAARVAEFRAQEESEHQRQLEELDHWEWECERGGRTPKVLPEEIARRVWDDVLAGHSHRAIERKYANTAWAFSRRWLERALANGTLAQMAGVGQSAGLNPAKKGHALAPV